ncbi:MAG: CaiB/BaiF CoA transferase family protein [Flavobacteriaceae bacterium]
MAGPRLVGDAAGGAPPMMPPPDLSRRPMEGVTIIDLTQIYNGPYATFLLAEAGARVIKIEPEGGEPLRRRGVVGGASLPFAMLNGGKECMTLDLKTPEGRDALFELARIGDVIVENFAPGTMDRLGIGAQTLKSVNPQLIYASSSGFGRDGQYRSYPAMDLTIQAMSGIMSVTGYPDRPPVKAGPAVGDFFAGVHLYGAIATALFERERTGVARRVEVSMQDAVYASLSSSLGLHWAMAGRSDAPPPRTGNRHAGMAEAPYNVYPAADGWVAIICVGDAHWQRLAAVMGQPELASDPRYSSLKARVEAMDDVDEIVGAWTGSRAKEDIFRELMAARIPCAPVRDLEEVVNDPNMHERGSLLWQDHPEYGRVVVQRSPLRFEGADSPAPAPSRPLGADTEKILSAFRASTKR